MEWPACATESNATGYKRAQLRCPLLLFPQLTTNLCEVIHNFVKVLHAKQSNPSGSLDLQVKFSIVLLELCNGGVPDVHMHPPGAGALASALGHVIGLHARHNQAHVAPVCPPTHANCGLLGFS